MRRSSVTYVCLLVATILSTTSAVRGDFKPLMTTDASQSLQTSADNAEEVFSGNQTANFTGPFLNGFAAPNSVNVRFDPASNRTIVSFTGQPISTDPTTRHTFGLTINNVTTTAGITTVNPGLVDAYWTLGQTIEGHLPEQDISIQYSALLRQAKITISNDPDTFDLFSVGYLVTNSPFALNALNRSSLPPSAFLPSGIADGTTLTPGSSVSFTVSGVMEGQFLTVFADAKFSGASAGNPYQDVSGRWLEIQAAPEPASWALMLVGATGMLGVLSRSRVTHRR